jgi:L-threonylcarbamoyladenylate synthase
LRGQTLDFHDAAAALGDGKILILPTDTLPGLHCRADNQSSVLRISEIKGRDDHKPLLVLAGSVQQAALVSGPWTPHQEKCCRACWPGPFSLILPARRVLADRVLAGEGTVAVRVPGVKLLRQLILEVGMPLVSTSVNFQGEKPLGDLERAWGLFGSRVDGMWCPPEGSFGMKTNPTASALVDLCGDRPQILREGPEGFPRDLDPNPRTP